MRHQRWIHARDGSTRSPRQADAVIFKLPHYPDCGSFVCVTQLHGIKVFGPFLPEFVDIIIFRV